MCARFTLRASAEVVAGLFEVDELPAEPPRYNIAPTQPVVAVIERKAGGRAAKLFQWGLIPSWAKDPSIGPRLINARAESLAERPAFKNALARRRCLIPADGFYEWAEIPEEYGAGGLEIGKREGPKDAQQNLFPDLDEDPNSKLETPHSKRKARKKQPYYIGLKDFSVFAFAGLWEFWEQPGGDTLYTCAIITTEPNELVRPMHDRMPVILRHQDYEAWLDRKIKNLSTLRSMLGPFPAEEMNAYPVSNVVNNANNETPDCVAPL